MIEEEEAAELTLPAEKMGDAFCFNYQSGVSLTIECNWCSVDDYMFFNDGSDSPDSKWFVRAVKHIMKYHKDRL